MSDERTKLVLDIKPGPEFLDLFLSHTTSMSPVTFDWFKQSTNEVRCVSLESYYFVDGVFSKQPRYRLQFDNEESAIAYLKAVNRTWARHGVYVFHGDSWTPDLIAQTLYD